MKKMLVLACSFPLFSCAMEQPANHALVEVVTRLGLPGEIATTDTLPEHTRQTLMEELDKISIDNSDASAGAVTRTKKKIAKTFIGDMKQPDLCHAYLVAALLAAHTPRAEYPGSLAHTMKQHLYTRLVALCDNNDQLVQEMLCGLAAHQKDEATYTKEESWATYYEESKDGHNTRSQNNGKIAVLQTEATTLQTTHNTLRAQMDALRAQLKEATKRHEANEAVKNDKETALALHQIANFTLTRQHQTNKAALQTRLDEIKTKMAELITRQTQEKNPLELTSIKAQLDDLKGQQATLEERIGAIDKPRSTLRSLFSGKTTTAK